MYREGEPVARPMTKKEKENYESRDWMRLPSYKMIESKGELKC